MKTNISIDGLLVNGRLDGFGDRSGRGRRCSLFARLLFLLLESALQLTRLDTYIY